jgi:hypothetical protein
MFRADGVTVASFVEMTVDATTGLGVSVGS